jgi:hypothetical protein
MIVSRLMHIFVVLLVFSVVCRAETKEVYLSQSGSGLQDGSSCANAQPVMWLNQESTTLVGGDKIHICDVITSMLEPKGDGAPDDPIRIIFEKNAKISAPTFWIEARHFGAGINLEGRHFYIVDGGENGTIEATSNGTPGSYQYSEDISGIHTDHAGDIVVRNLTIRGMYRRVPNSQDANKYGCGTWGSSMTGTNVFENNVIEDANCGVQWNTDSTLGGTLIIRNNSMSRVSWGFASGGGGDVRLQFYGNNLSDGYVWSGHISTGDGHFHNDPFHIWTTSSNTRFVELKIYNNRITGDWGDNTTGAIYLECRGSENDCPAFIFNNIISTRSGFTNGAIALKFAEHVRIFNNVFACPGNAIHLEGSTFGDRSTSSRYIDVENNLFDGVGVPLAENDGSSYGMVDYNAYWHTAPGNDPHKITGDPKINQEFVPRPGSSLIGHGVNLSAYFTADFTGAPRPQEGPWTIGAFEAPNK